MISVAVIAALAATLIVRLSSASVSDPPPAPTGPDVGQSSILSGPGGRVALSTWVLRRDPANVGLRDGWAGGDFAGGTVTVPHVANALPVSGPSVSKNYAGSIGWYRTRFDVGADGTYIVRFESANFFATVWLDGKKLGTHVGEYQPFEFRIQPAAGPHTLVVRADWRDPNAQTALGWHRTWFNFGGLDGEVTIRPVGQSELIDPTLQTKLVAGAGGEQAQVQVSVRVRNDGPTRTITPQGTLTHGAQSVPLDFSGETVAQGATATMTAQALVATPALWAPGSPNLYDMQLAVANESSYEASVGLRQLTWSDGRLYLNGRHLTLHGASIQEDADGHGDALTPADQDQLVADLRAIGANATRSQHPLDAGLLDKLDAAGILVWQGVGPTDASGNWTAKTPALFAQAEQRVRITAKDEQLHPSIIAWNLANEVAGNGHPGGQARYIEEMTRWLHDYDPGRMVAVDVWGAHPPHVAGALYRDVDAVSLTDYAGWYEDPLGQTESVSSFIKKRLVNLHAVFPDKVLVISEFGAEANRENPSPGLGSYTYQTDLLAEHIRLYKDDPALSGMLVWSLRDFAVAPTFAGGSIGRVDPSIQLVKGVDQKGLFAYDNRAKPAAAMVARAFSALGPF